MDNRIKRIYAMGYSVGFAVIVFAIGLISDIESARADAPDWFARDVMPPATVLLSLDPAADGGGFRLGPDMTLVEDDQLGIPVWTYAGDDEGWIGGRDMLPEFFALEACVRVTGEGRMVTLAIGEAEDGPQLNDIWELSLSPIRSRRGEPQLRVETRRPQRDHYLEEPTLRSGGAAQSLPPALPPVPDQVDFGYRFNEAPSPLTDEEYRIEVEHVLAERERLPGLTEKWHRLRVERCAERLRFFVNGVPVGESALGGPRAGKAQLRFDDATRVAGLELRPLGSEFSAYYPVDISERLNERAVGADGPVGLAPDALPEAGSRGEVAGIPFHFGIDQSGRDHIDINRSIFRERNRFGHRGMVTLHIWPCPRRQFDPGRIAFSVPNHAWARIWVVAAFDETPDATPVLTARFYKPGRGFPVDSAVSVPALSARSAPGAARRLPVRRADGSHANLWLVPIDLDTARLAAEMRDMDHGGPTGRNTHADRRDNRSFALSLELTRDVQSFRPYPDPHNYGWFQGGAPSGVRVFAMTLEKAPVHMVASGNRVGNAYISPERPLWQVDLNSQHDQALKGLVRLTVTDPYGRPAGEVETPFSLSAGGSARLDIPLEPEVFGVHTVRTALELDESSGLLSRVFSREEPVSLSRIGTFIQLPPDERVATPETSRWGLWSSPGAHLTLDGDDYMYLIRAAGARFGGHPDPETARQWGVYPRTRHIGHGIRRDDGSGWRQRGAQAWAFEDPYCEEAYAENRDVVGKNVARWHEENPLSHAYSFLVETSITRHLTRGIPRRYIGEDPTWTEEEEHRVRGHMIYGRAVAEGIRQHAPDAKIALGWAYSSFPVPMLEAGFPRELFDYIGVDEPTFEWTPEMPIATAQTANRLWLLRQAMIEHGYDDVPIVHVESYFPSSNPLALGWRRSADHTVRLPLLALAHIPNTTFTGIIWHQDNSSWYGSQHYGESGLLGRNPEANPKPAFAAFATMTRLLDPGEYQGWLATGSRSAYCLHFTSNGRHVYPMWNLRGRREARLQLPEGATAVMVDESGNEFPLSPDAENRVRVSLTPTPLWVTSDLAVESVSLGEVDHGYVAREHPLMHAAFSDGAGRRYRPENQIDPGEHAIVLDRFDAPWPRVPGPYPAHENQHEDVVRYEGPMRSEAVADAKSGATVWQVTLEEPDVQRELAAWYAVFEPATPLTVPGRARALGVWADGRSNWGRIIYELEDAGGEIWRSTGTVDAWNCDDIHTWSTFSHDGWRYMEFPMPGHLPYDNYRTKDTTWWGSDGNRVVELPVKIRRIIIEHRTHNIYVDELMEEPDRSVRLRDLTAVYDEADLMTEAAVELQRRLAGALRWDTDGALLPNPIAELRDSGVGEPTGFATIQPPDDDDTYVTRLEITLDAVENAREYRIYVSAYEDGRGAIRVASEEEPRLRVSRLPAGTPLYLFATWRDEEGRESQPTPAWRILLVEHFGFQ